MKILNPKMEVFGYFNSCFWFPWYHIITQLAVYTTYIPLIYCQLGDYIYHLPPIDYLGGFPFQLGHFQLRAGLFFGGKKIYFDNSSRKGVFHLPEQCWLRSSGAFFFLNVLEEFGDSFW